jgi:hypothetical protein
MCGEELVDEGAVEVAGLLKGLVVDLVVDLVGPCTGACWQGLWVRGIVEKSCGGAFGRVC